MVEFVIIVLASAAITYLVLVVIPYQLAKRNILWTTMDVPGRSKDIVDAGGNYIGTVLAKPGFKVAVGNGREKRQDGSTAAKNDFVMLGPGEVNKTGLFWVGIPILRRVYVRDMVYNKAIPSETDTKKMIIHRDWKDIDFTLVMPYYYGIDLPSVEDINNVPVILKLAIAGECINSGKLNFGVDDFYIALVGLVLRPTQHLMRNRAYQHVEKEEEKKKLKNDLSMQIMTALRTPQIDEAGKVVERSPYDIAQDDYGLWIKGILVMDISLPPTYEGVATRNYVANATADAEAIETQGAFDRMTDKGIRKRAKNLGFDKDAFKDEPEKNPDFIAYLREHPDVARATPEELRTIATNLGFASAVSYKDNPEDNPEFKQYLREHPETLDTIDGRAENMLLRDRAAETGGLRDLRVANADGSKMDSITGTVMAAIMAAKSADVTEEPPKSDRRDDRRSDRRNDRRKDSKKNQPKKGGDQNQNTGNQNQGGQGKNSPLDAPIMTPEAEAEFIQQLQDEAAAEAEKNEDKK